MGELSDNGRMVWQTLFFAIGVCFVLFLISMLVLSKNPMVFVVRMEADNNTLEMTEIANNITQDTRVLELQEEIIELYKQDNMLSNFRGCIHRCEYIGLKNNYTKPDIYDCISLCEVK